MVNGHARYEERSNPIIALDSNPIAIYKRDKRCPVHQNGISKAVM